MKEKHGMCGTRIYRIWASMKNRCKGTKHSRYGGRGIKVCERWLSFNNFKDDMYESYLEHVERHGEFNTSIDRKNNDGNYEPGNCRWATRLEQNENTVYVRTFLAISPNGEKFVRRSQPQFAKEHGLNVSHVNHYLRGQRKHCQGWHFEYLDNHKGGYFWNK